MYKLFTINEFKKNSSQFSYLYVQFSILYHMDICCYQYLIFSGNLQAGMIDK